MQGGTVVAASRLQGHVESVAVVAKFLEGVCQVGTGCSCCCLRLTTHLRVGTPCQESCVIFQLKRLRLS